MCCAMYGSARITGQTGHGRRETTTLPGRSASEHQRLRPLSFARNSAASAADTSVVAGPIERRRHGRDAGADCHDLRAPRALVIDREILDRRAQPLGDDAGAGRIGIGKERDELLAAVACEDIRRPAQAVRHRGGDVLQAAVATEVTVVLVVGVKVVDIDEHQ